MSEDDSAIRWAKLNKNAFRSFLQERYGKKMGEKMVQFIDTNLMQVFRNDFKSYVKMIRDFLKGGTSLWNKFAFHILNMASNGKLCEHDMFQILDHYKQRDVIQFYMEMFNKRCISNHFRETFD